MKRLLPFLIILLNINFIQADPISKESAKNVAVKYFKYRNGNKTDTRIKTFYVNYYKNKTTFYVVNFVNGGFVIVSADDVVKPILAYSCKNTIPKEIKNSEVKWWLEGYSKEINNIVSKKSDNSATLKEWYDIINEHTKSEKTYIYLVGTKSDIIDKLTIKQDIIDEWIKNHDRIKSFYLTSSVTGENIEEIFTQIAKDSQALIEKARSETNVEKRRSLYNEAVRHAHERAYFVWLLNIEDVYGLSKRLQWKGRVDAKILVSEMTLSK